MGQACHGTLQAGAPLRSGRLYGVGLIPLRTRAMDVLAQLGRGAVHELDEEQLDAIRNRPMRYVPPITWVTGKVLRSVRISTGTVPVRDGREIGVRWYHPRDADASTEPLPLVVYLHGGGWVLGNPANYDPLCTFLADAAGVIIANPDYRLAPTHPAPNGLEDCLDAIAWLSRHAGDRGADAGRIGVAGDSAGGNLAAVAAQHFTALARDTGCTNVVKHQALLYPSLDSTCLYKSKIDRANGPILRRNETDGYLSLYLGGSPGALSAHDPRVSPLIGDVDGLPPTLIQTAGLDPLRDEGWRYAARLRAAGVEVVSTDYPRCPHGFASYPGAGCGGWAHRDELATEIRRHLHD